MKPGAATEQQNDPPASAALVELVRLIARQTAGQLIKARAERECAETIPPEDKPK